MIRWIQIIHNSGFCLYFGNYCKQDVDQDLSSGLVSAILNFAKEVHNETIKEIHMEHNRIIYGIKEPIAIAVSATEGTKKKKLTCALDCIMKAFFDNYSKHLEHNILDPKTFMPFSSTIDDEFMKNGLTTNLFGKKIDRDNARKSLLQL